MTRIDSTIKNLCIEICLRNKNSINKRNKELDKIKVLIRSSDLFKGKKRKIIKLINNMKKKK